jgi:hypothetical protein
MSTKTLFITPLAEMSGSIGFCDRCRKMEMAGASLQRRGATSEVEPDPDIFTFSRSLFRLIWISFLWYLNIYRLNKSYPDFLLHYYTHPFLWSFVDPRQQNIGLNQHE